MSSDNKLRVAAVSDGGRSKDVTMNKSQRELLDDILTQIDEQFEATVEKLTKRLADLAMNGNDKNVASKTTADPPDGDERQSEQ